MVKLLLSECPCDHEKPNRHGVTPLEAARGARRKDVVTMLEKHYRRAAGHADWLHYKPPRQEKLPSIHAARPPASEEADPGDDAERARDDAASSRESHGWVCGVCKRRNDASDFRDPRCRVCRSAPSYSGDYTADQEAIRSASAPPLDYIRRMTISEMRLEYKI